MTYFMSELSNLEGGAQYTKQNFQSDCVTGWKFKCVAKYFFQRFYSYEKINIGYLPFERSVLKNIFPRS